MNYEKVFTEEVSPRLKCGIEINFQVKFHPSIYMWHPDPERKFD